MINLHPSYFARLFDARADTVDFKLFTCFGCLKLHSVDRCLEKRQKLKNIFFFSIKQGKGRRRGMTENDRHRAICMLKGGMSVNAVAISFGIHRNTIWKLSERHRTTGSVLDRPRSGRPKALTAREERYLSITSRRDRFLSAMRLADRFKTAVGVRVSAQTVRNRLKSSDLRVRRPHKR